MSQELIPRPSTERKLLVNNDQEISYNDTQVVNRKHTFISQGFTGQQVITLYLPTIVYCFLTQIVKVDLAQKQVQCKFTVYVSVNTNLSDTNQKSLAKMSKEKKLDFDALNKFLNNNLIVQCGSQVIDIINADQEEDLYSTNRSQANNDDDNQSSESEGECYWTKMTQQEQVKTVTYKIEGIFDCKFQLQNFFFPYHHINSGLEVRIRAQYYNRLLIKYELYSLKNILEKSSIKQISLKFVEKSFTKFGNYSINCSEQTYDTKNDKTVNADFKPRGVQVWQTRFRKNDSNFIKSTQFFFQIYSYSQPFMLRYLIPLLVLCFVSLMTYYADSTQIGNIFGNVILISITLIQQLSNFRSSKYDNNSINFYQATILVIIAINFLLVIITINNYYQLVSSDASDQEKKEANQNHVIFWVSVGLAGLCLVVNTITVLYFKCKVLTQYSWQAHQKKELRNLNHLWIWNQELFGSPEEYALDSPVRRSKKSYK